MRANQIIVIPVLFLLLSTEISAQRGKGYRDEGRGHREKVVVVRHSDYRPAKIGIYHPAWRPDYAYHRRWVYFPRYNFYWDNWRNHYVYLNGNVWLSQPAPPPMIVNINLGKERSTELKENDDEEDEIYRSNDSHKTVYRNE